MTKVINLNLKEVYELQRELDSRIGYNKTDRFQKKILATIVEIGEAANELKGDGFKFWSNKTANREALKEELSDVFHFIISLGLEVHTFFDTYEFVVRKVNAQDQFIRLTKRVLELYSFATMGLNTHKTHNVIIQEFFILCHSLDFSHEEMIEAYKEKNAINHQRQLEGY